MIDKTKIIIVDDHKLFRIGLKAALSQSPSISIIGEAESSETLFRLLESGQIPDIVLLDIIMPVVSGIQTAKLLRQKYPNIKILMLSVESNEKTITELMEIGIDGFINKAVEIDELKKAIEFVADGAEYFGKDISRIIHYIRVSKKNVKDSVFTPTELNIVNLCSKGLSSKEIANQLGTSLKTVENHKNHIFKKLGINNSIELVLYAIRNGIVEI